MKRAIRRWSPGLPHPRSGTPPGGTAGAARGGTPTVRDGFTLVEVIAVVLLLGIVLGFAMPRIDVAGYRMRGATQSVSTTILAAQRLAVMRQHNIVVAIDTAGRMLRLHEDRNNDGVMDAGEPVRSVELGEGAVFGRGGAAARPMGEDAVSFTRTQGGLPAVTFHRDGSASEEGGFYITTGRAARSGAFPEDTRAIEISRATGRTSWHQYRSAAWQRGF